MSQQESVYTRTFTEKQVVTAKTAKEVFFLTTEDLSQLDFQREKGWSAYCSRSGACKLFNANEVRNMALRKFGGAHELEKKLQAKKKRRVNRMEKDRQKRLKEEEERVAAAQAKMQAILERKRKAEEQVRDAESWQKLVATVGKVVDPTEIQKLIDDAMAWRQHCAGGHDKGPLCKKRKEESSMKNVLPIM